ncbi:MAG TPA: universal stress protein [Terriglobales bacterium]|nr:universal stress protein [Terriglobales bacterium]
MALAQAIPRLHLRNILFTTDFSSASDSALPYALALGRWYESRIVIAHVVPREPQLSIPLDLLSKQDDPNWRRARQRMGTLSADTRIAEQRHEEILIQGDLRHVLSGIICQHEIDMLVLGTHGRQGLSKLVLGSSAEEIFRHASCPVLTVGPKVCREPEGLEALATIVFATDFSPASLHALPYALSLAEENQARLIMVHLMALVPFQQREAVTEAETKRLKALVPPDAESWCRPEFVVNFQFPAEGILEAVEHYNGDLLVMGVHKREAPRLAAHMLWTTAYDVVCNAPCPVLTVRA